MPCEEKGAYVPYAPQTIKSATAYIQVWLYHYSQRVHWLFKTCHLCWIYSGKFDRIRLHDSACLFTIDRSFRAYFFCKRRELFLHHPSTSCWYIRHLEKRGKLFGHMNKLTDLFWGVSCWILCFCIDYCILVKFTA